MIPEIGQFALILALVISLIQGTLPLVGAAKNRTQWIAVARPAARGQFLFVITAFFCLMQAYVTSDFSVANVAHNSHTLKPMLYKVSGVWGNHEGSMVLWVASNNQAVHRMPKPPLRAGFVTDDGRRYALKQMPLRQHAFVQDSDNFNNTHGG